MLLPCERLKIYPSHLVCKITLYFPVSNMCKKPRPSSERDNCLTYVLTSLSSWGINFNHNLAPRDYILKHEFESRYLEYEVLKCKKSKADGIPWFPEVSSADLKSSSFRVSLDTEMWFSTAARPCTKFPWMLLGRCHTTTTELICTAGSQAVFETRLSSVKYSALQ